MAKTKTMVVALVWFHFHFSAGSKGKKGFQFRVKSVSIFGTNNCLISKNIPLIKKEPFCQQVDQTILATCTRVAVNTARVVTTMYASELFPTSVRGIAVGIAMAGSETGGAVAPFIAQFVSKAGFPLKKRRLI